MVGLCVVWFLAWLGLYGYGFDDVLAGRRGLAVVGDVGGVSF